MDTIVSEGTPLRAQPLTYQRGAVSEVIHNQRKNRIGYDYLYLLRCHRAEDVDNIPFKIAATCPPNFEEIKKMFPLCERPGVLFCYGDTIYNPHDVEVRRSIVAHECTHMLQQRNIKGGVEEWWKLYLDSREFRFQQELDAHRIEYRDFLAQGANRHQRRAEFKIVAQKLASPLYGNLVTVSTAEKYILTELEDKELEL